MKNSSLYSACTGCGYETYHATGKCQSCRRAERAAQTAKIKARAN